MKKIVNFKGILCCHKWVLIEEVYGDIRSDFNGIYKCEKCGKEKYT